MRKSYTAAFKAKVALEAVRGQQSLAELASRYEVHANPIGLGRKALMEGVSEIFSDKRRKRDVDEAEEKARLFEEIGRLKVELDWLKKNPNGWSVEERRAKVDVNHAVLSVARQCELLGLSRSAYSYRPVEVSAADLERMRRLDAIYKEHPYFGRRRLRNRLKSRWGDRVGRGHVRTLMRRMGIEAIYPKRRLSLPDPGNRVYPYLLRGMRIERPDQVWCSDITYLRLKNGFGYLTAVMDGFSRYVVSWKVSWSLEGEFCVERLTEALSVSTPEIFNTDQGCPYTSERFTKELLNRGIRVSMEGKGRAFDNIMIERLWRTVKYEDVYLKD